jgi:XRE family aerobic/anaerobic benzoate catabolism transcriptional regulator
MADLDQPLLRALGRRLAGLRAGRGMSASGLAEAAGLSRRYVTEAEGGRANLSLVKLASLARALRVPLRELCDLPLSPPERVALLGLRGAGKSSVGAALAQALEVPFVELDRRVEALAGAPMATLLELEGEATWARLELEALEEVLASGQRLVIEVPGSVVARPATFERVLEACRTVWLQATPEEHWERVVAQGDLRPMAGRPEARQELAALWASRERAYRRCDRLQPTSGRSVEEVATELLQSLPGARP